eukprot:scaffold123566_cov15-Tisochrysis_lutea.AAC.1
MKKDKQGKILMRKQGEGKRKDRPQAPFTFRKQGSYGPGSLVEVGKRKTKLRLCRQQKYSLNQ